MGFAPAAPTQPAAETPAAETPAAETPAAETPAAETPAAETPAAAKPAAEVVRIPDSDDEGRHDAEVLDVLERLVEPVGTAPLTDPGEMRARLARTAAAKKPGSRSDERFHE